MSPKQYFPGTVQIVDVFHARQQAMGAIDEAIW
jgi:hypothetical protein